MRHNHCMAKTMLLRLPGVVAPLSHEDLEFLQSSAMLSCMHTRRHPTPGLPLTLQCILYVSGCSKLALPSMRPSYHTRPLCHTMI